MNGSGAVERTAHADGAFAGDMGVDHGIAEVGLLYLPGFTRLFPGWKGTGVFARKTVARLEGAEKTIAISNPADIMRNMFGIQ